jgi:hypothetical protein|tara:strand:- start:812 stop:1210 length:399 start_codon:yes stop_codon:yes gene_type:complete
MSVEVVLDIDSVWSEVVSYIDRVIPYVHNDFTTQDVREKLLSNEYNLILFKDKEQVIGVVVFSTEVIAHKKSAFIVVIAGKHITNDKMWVDLKTLFSSLGYVYIEAAMRDSTLRLWSKLGFKKKYNMAGVNI